MAVGASAFGAPRGSPQIARMCCSNWDVDAPSIVQWPLLWTRGASSLTTSEPSRSRNSSTVSVPTRSIAAARLSAIAVASRRAAAGRSAGVTDSTRIPASWTLRAGGKIAGFPSVPRATITDSSVSKSSSRSASSGTPSGPPKQTHRGFDVRDTGDADLTAAVVPAGRRLEPERGAEVRGGSGESLRRRDCPPGGDRDPGTLDEPPLCQPVLRHAQRLDPRANRRPLDGRADDLKRDMLELVRHDVSVGRQLAAQQATSS